MQRIWRKAIGVHKFLTTPCLRRALSLRWEDQFNLSLDPENGAFLSDRNLTAGFRKSWRTLFYVVAEILLQ